MSVVEMIKELLNKQNALNVETTGLQNYAFLNITDKDRPIDYCRELSLELGELLDSTPHKHWKDITELKFDRDNIFVENVDGLHFFLSIMLQLIARYEYLTIDKVSGVLSTIISEVEADMPRILATLNNDDDVVKSTTKFYFKINKILLPVREATLSVQEVGEFRAESTGLLMIGKLFKYLYALYLISTYDPVAEVVKSFDDLHTGYFTKNLLNKFRKDHGYQNGTYHKKWLYGDKLVEDNVVAFDIANNMTGVFNGDAVYLELVKHYLFALSKAQDFVAMGAVLTHDRSGLKTDLDMEICEVVTILSMSDSHKEIEDLLTEMGIGLCVNCGCGTDIATSHVHENRYVCNYCTSDLS